MDQVFVGTPMTFADKLDRLVVEEWKNEGRPMPWVEFKQAILRAAIAQEEERQAYYAALVSTKVKKP